MRSKIPRNVDTWKRVYDLSIAGPAFVLSLPLQLVVTILVLRKLGRPILFRQERPGLDGVPFTLLKFRSMYQNDSSACRVTDDQRLGRFGRLLRASSLDELPSLWNVLKGDMSLVGPRPLLNEYVPLYNAKQSRRHEVRPGITGLAQISGRNAISWDAKFDHDIAYVDSRSFSLDTRILFRTLTNVLLRKGISADRHPTMPRFTGNSN